MRVGVVLIAALLLAGSPADAATAPYWSVGKVLRRLDGAKIQVGSRKIRVDSETTLCAGYGTSIRRGRERPREVVVLAAADREVVCAIIRRRVERCVDRLSGVHPRQQGG